jgi:hypothetical protein
MKKLLVLIFVLVLSLEFQAQGWRPIGARSSGLSNASVGISDVWSYYNNPAATAELTQMEVGAFYETRFLSKELQTQALAFALPIKKGVFSVGAFTYGYEQYRATRGGLGYALKLSDNFYLGAQANLNQLRFNSNYGSSLSATAEVGLLAKISEKWMLGLSAMNIGSQKISSTEERFTSVLRAGFRFKVSEKVLILGEIEKQVIHPFSFKTGVEYLPIEHLFIRLGAQSGPASFSFGFGYKKKQFAIDLSTNYHQILGWSPSFGLNYQFKKNEK